MLRRKQSKAYRFVAAFLALLMLASLIPVSHAGLVQAADILESYTVTLTDGSQDGEGNYIPLMQEGVEVTLTDPSQQEAEPLSASTDANGVATFANCVEDGKTYQLSVTGVNGYEDLVSTNVTPALNDINYYAVLIPAQPQPVTTTISGTVNGSDGQGYSGAQVSLFEGTIEESEAALFTTDTDASGGYTFPNVDISKSYTIRVEPKGEDPQYKTGEISITGLTAEPYTASTLTLEKEQFSIAVDAKENGSVTVNGSGAPFLVDYGENAEIKVEAATGYRIGTLTVDNEIVVAEAAGQQNYTYTISAVTKGHKVSVTFLRQTYTITFTVGENGKVEYANGIEAVDGGSVSFDESTDPEKPTTVTVTATPDVNYRVKEVKIDGTSVNDDENQRNDLEVANNGGYKTDLEMTKDYTFSVTFELNKYEISVADEAKDYISVSQNEAEHGSDVTATITPPEGKTIFAFTVNGEQVDLSRLSLVEGNRYEIQYSQTVTGDVVFNADFGDISELQGNYQDYVSISQPLQQIGDQYIYSNNTQSVILKAAEGYEGIAVNGSYSVGTSGWSTDTSKEVETIQVLDGVVLKQVTMESPIQIIIDKGKPEVTDVQTTADSWTNQAVTVTVTAADEGNFASGVARVVYNTEQTVEGAQEAQRNQDGKYSFTLDSEQNATYYIYAVDRSGNVSAAAQTEVQIDKTPPEIIGFSFSSQEDAAVSDGINFKKFGIYSANPIYVTVTAGDDASGVASITLYKGGANETLNAVNGSATFELNADEFAGGAKITAIATDVAGNAVNESESKGPADTGSALSNFVQINATAPTVTIVPDDPGYTAENGAKWYGGDTKFTVTISDTITGIQSVEISLNDVPLSQDSDGVAIGAVPDTQETQTLTYVISTTQAAANTDGSYTLEVTATNNAGVPYDENPATDTVYLDVEGPDIVDITVENHARSTWEKVVNFLSFGMFFKDEVDVTVTVSDPAPSAGFGAATLTATVDGEEFASIDDAPEAVVNEDGEATEQYAYTFTLPAPEEGTAEVFYENVTIVVNDLVNHNVSTSVGMEGAANNIMIEAENPVISTSLPGADATVETENETQAWYRDDIEIGVSIMDENSGLHHVWILDENNQSNVLVEETLSKQQETETKQTSWETTINTSQATWDEKNGSYRLVVIATDNAGNESSTPIVVYKDKSAPEFKTVAINPVEQSTGEKIINFLTFGNFCKQQVQITVAASDAPPSAGLATATLTGEPINDSEQRITATAEPQDGKYTFTVPAEAVGTEEEVYFNQKLSVEVLDRVGNSTGATRLSAISNEDDIDSDQVLIETQKPIISDITTSSQGETFEAVNGQKWFDEQTITFSFTVSDLADGTLEEDASGLQRVRVYDANNGYDPENPEAALVLDQEFTNADKEVTWSTSDITSEKVVRGNDGSYHLVIVATDNAGNQNEPVDFIVYQDLKAPELTDIEITPVQQSTFKQVINFLSFGNFCKQQVQITVAASDAPPSAGLATATLYRQNNSGEWEQLGDPASVMDERTFVFKVPVDEVGSEEKVYFNEALAVKVEDAVGHSNGPTSLSAISNEDNIDSDQVMIETQKPIISDITTSSQGETFEAVNGQKWFDEQTITFSFTVSDLADGTLEEDASGLQRVRVYDANNGYDPENPDAAVVLDKEFTNPEKEVEWSTSEITSEKVVRGNDGSYHLVIVATDNAGNQNEPVDFIVYQDLNDPQITNFAFSHEQYVEGSEEPVVEQTEYGYYFRENTDVTVTAADDGPSAGLRTVSFYTVDVEGTRTEYVGQPADQAVFTIPANFKGQIYAKATDNVDNTPVEGGADGKGYVTPDGVILETQDKHNQENHITFTKEDTPYRDANGLELYGSDVPVNITITDTYSGIRRVEWSVTAPYDTANNQSGEVNVENNGGLTAEGWQITDQQNNLVTAMNTTINVSNDSNGIVLSVTMTDRAGNTSTQSIQFSVDKTAPVIDVVYDNNSPDATYTDIYQADRTATITVTERNFNAADIQTAITNTDGVIPTLTGWEEHWNATDPNASYYVAHVSYTADGDYTFDIGYTDRAGHTAAAVSQHRFTIDKTIPTLSVSYNNNDVMNGNYYSAQRTATITIVEHNFDPTRVTVLGTATDNGAASVFPTLGGWTTQGDTHTATLLYAADGLYTFDIEFNDMAGNAIADFAPQTFYVDQTAPTLEITGVGNQSANNGTVAPVITFFDTNFNPDAVSISLSGVNNGTVNYAGAYEEIANGRRFTYADFEHTKQVDDIYTLTVSLTDRAGNVTTQTITFSANRFGSTYDLTDLADLSGKFVQTEEDVIFEEINVDALNHDTIRIVMTKNGTPVDLVEGTDYTVEVTGGNGQWSVYRYIINRSLFVDDGRYTISVYSVDSAGNINENIDEAKQAEISFGVDKTAPVIVPLDLDNGAQYPVQVKDTTVEIRDNLVLENVTIYLNDQAVEYQENEESYQFSIPETNSLQDVRIVAEDAAGNQQEVTVADFLVSTNFFVRWYNNTPLFIGTIAGVVVIALGITAFLVFGRRKKKDEEQEEG